MTVSNQWLRDWLPQIVGQAGNFETIVFGVLMIVILQRAPDGLWPAITRRLSVRSAPAAPAIDQRRCRSRPPIARAETLLDVKEVTKRFGGLVAVDRMSLTVRAGEIVALIGPNGAGKTTVFNVISGVLDATSGAVTFRGGDVSKSESRDIAKLGLSRTFQHVRLLPQMSVIDNVAIGAHRREYPGLLAGVIAGAWRLDRTQRSRLLAESARQLERVGLARAHIDAAGSLPLGKQRTLEIARALASDPALLLLDEPAAGLRYLEKRSLAELLRKLREEGLGILLVEHDMDFVMGTRGSRLRDGLRPEDRRRHARRSAARSARDRGVPGRRRRKGCGMSAARMSTASVLEVTDLSVAYGKVAAVAGARLSRRPGSDRHRDRTQWRRQDDAAQRDHRCTAGQRQRSRIDSLRRASGQRCRSLDRAHGAARHDAGARAARAVWRNERRRQPAARCVSALSLGPA